MNKRLLKELLRVPTVTGNEGLMVEWLMEYFTANSAYQVKRDGMGNVYVTKGISQAYPCVCAHIDTVHPLTNVTIHEEGDRLHATDWSGKQVGCGGDDKTGIYICLQLLEQASVLKAVFFVSEESGCQGAWHANEDWFGNVGYAMEFDSPCDDIMTFICNGIQLFPVSGPFYDAAMPVFKKYGVLNWQRHPYTDVSVLKRKFTFPCLNLPAGYFRMHSLEEYVQMSVVDASVSLGIDLLKALGTARYVFKQPLGECEDLSGLPVQVTYLKVHDFGHRPTTKELLQEESIPVRSRSLQDRMARLTAKPK